MQRKPAAGHTFKAAGEAVPIDAVALGRYLSGHGLIFDADVPIRQFATGLANINYLLSVGGRSLVLRRPPSGELPPGAHDMTREHRILSRLHRAFPLAPESVHLCTDISVLGVPFQLMEYRPGIVIKGDDRTEFAGQPSRAAATGRMLVETLAALHRVDPQAVGLGDLGKPEGFVARQIAGWRGRAERASEKPAIRALAGEIGGWLGRQSVRERRPVLLHCDFKLDNLILTPGTLAPVAVVDWDMGTRGDPLFDLATLLSYWTEAGDPSCMHELKQMPTAAPGFPARDELVAAYARATGTEVSDYPVLRVLGLLKLSVIFLQLHALWVKGATLDPRYQRFGRLGEELMEMTGHVAGGRL